MTVKDIDELASETYLQSGEVNARIADLEENADPSNYADGDSWEDGMGELEELKAFRDEVTGYMGAARWNNGMSLVRDSAWEEFAEDEAESLYGREAVDSGYFQLDRFALDLQADYQDAELNGITFWYR